MKIYRISKKEYRKDLSGEGARLYGGRWNRRGDAVVYFSESLALATLELLVHLDYEFVNDSFYFMEVEIHESLLTTLKSPAKITEKWRDNPPNSRTQDYGSAWLESNKSLGLKVPSAVLPFESNILVNPMHIKKLKIVKSEILKLDNRL
ncbi:MAG: RES family NAD+ phosphorylase [Patiriisocius sp.]|uniref:RES family NAD+ phosphorylase n=1 Tax=Patiriisocius sp. TaxID=2822396 RepID=UPI003EF872EA